MNCKEIVGPKNKQTTKTWDFPETLLDYEIKI